MERAKINKIQGFKKSVLIPYSYIMPSLLVFALVIILPAIVTLLISFYDFSGYDKNIFRNFIGLENFRTLFGNSYFWMSVRNTFFFIFGTVVIQLMIALFLAIIIFFGNFKNSILIRTMIFFPGVLAPVAVSLAFRRILAQDGVINRILNIDYSWLSDTNLVIWIVILVNTWQWVGWNLVIFYAGLQSIDIEMLEAADVDGASWSGKIFRIVIPSIIPTIILNIVLNLIGGFRVFDIVYVLTGGGPAHSSEVLTTLMYWYTFASQGPSKMGVGSAVAFIMFLIMIIFGFFRTRLLKR